MRDITVNNVQTTGIDEDDHKAMSGGEFSFHEIYANMPRVDDGFLHQQFPLAEPIRRRVSKRFPRTTASTPGSPFQIRSFLVISISELLNASSVNPLPNQNVVVWSLGDDDKAKKAVESGWEFSECDSAHRRTRHYKARVPVTILGQPSDVTTPLMDYLEDDSRVLAPHILDGHVSAGTTVEFELARPMLLRGTVTGGNPGETTSRMGLYQMFGSFEPIDAKAGQYVGALWYRKIHADGDKPSPQLEMPNSQVVLM